MANQIEKTSEMSHFNGENKLTIALMIISIAISGFVYFGPLWGFEPFGNQMAQTLSWFPMIGNTYFGGSTIKKYIEAKKRTKK